MKIRVTHVEFEGSDEGATAVLDMIARTFAPRIVDALPALEPLPAIAELPSQEYLDEANKLADEAEQRREPPPAPPAPRIVDVKAELEQRPARRLKIAAKPSTTTGSPKPARNKLVLICREQAGQFDVVAAATLAKVKPQSIHAALQYAKLHDKEWACAGEFQFKRATSSAPAAIVETKPADDDDDVMPINPHIRGGNRQQPSERPTPADIAAN